MYDIINDLDLREIKHSVIDGPRVTYCPYTKVLEIHDDSDPEKSSVKICIEDVGQLIRNIQMIAGEDLLDDSNEVRKAN